MITNPRNPQASAFIPTTGGWSQVNQLYTGVTNPVNGIQASFPVAATYTIAFSITPQQLPLPNLLPFNPKFGVVNGSTSVTTAMDLRQYVFSGQQLAFSSGVAGDAASTPGPLFTVGSVTATAINLTSPYTGTTQTAASGWIYISQAQLTFTNNNIVPLQCDAIISWKLESNNLPRRINVGNGVSISGRANGVGVLLLDQTSIAGNFTPLPYRLGYTVDVFVAPGVRGSTAIPPTLQGLTLNLAATPPIPQVGSFLLSPLSASADIQIPLNAGIVSVEVLAIDNRTGTPANNVQVELVGATNIAATQVYKVFGVSNGLGFVSVPPAATDVLVTNYDAVNTVLITTTFGIDG